MKFSTSFFTSLLFASSAMALARSSYDACHADYALGSECAWREGSGLWGVNVGTCIENADSETGMSCNFEKTTRFNDTNPTKKEDGDKKKRMTAKKPLSAKFRRSA